MKQASVTLQITTPGQSLTDVTADIMHWLAEQGVTDGLLTVFIPHTSASLVIQENADPDVTADLQAFFSKLVREDLRLYRHKDEGPDDMPAHIRAALTQTSLSVPIVAGCPVLGTWQGIYLFEHRVAPHRRHIVLHVMGE